MASTYAADTRNGQDKQAEVHASRVGVFDGRLLTAMSPGASSEPIVILRTCVNFPIQNDNYGDVERCRNMVLRM